jgi:hypothetical protein
MYMGRTERETDIGACRLLLLSAVPSAATFQIMWTAKETGLDALLQNLCVKVTYFKV